MSEEKMSNSRRDFIKTAVAGAAAFSILPSSVIAGLGNPMPSDKLNIAAIGVGGIGFNNLNSLKNENIVALCDVDWEYGQKTFRRWGNATRYKDFRVMFDNEKNIDAVLIASPDHTHAIAAISAMQLQKHVFVQAPMARSVFEMRKMVDIAKVYEVATQAGNQVASSDFTRDIAETFWKGYIGEVRDVFVWTSDPRWKQGVELTDKRNRIPSGLDWDLFIGPSAFLPYNPDITPFGWRAFWNFGNGTLGAAGAHLLEPVFRALQLGVVDSVEASSGYYSLDVAPASEKIVFDFTQRDNMPKVAMPGVKVHWYDGGLLPDLPVKIPKQVNLNEFQSGIIFKGSEGMIVANVPDEVFYVIRDGEVITPDLVHSVRRVENSTLGHEADWVRACKESSRNRLPASADFEGQAAMTETILVGTMALRMQSFRRKLKWDSAQMKFSNIYTNEEFEIVIPGGLYIENGIPKFNSTTKKYNAVHFVDQTVRPTYRDKWQQV